MTNLEYLRTLEAEELAQVLRGDECETCTYVEETHMTCCGNCRDGFIEWLKQERDPELKPCPFCGYEARAHETEGGLSFVFCNNCSAEVQGKTNAEAIEVWNRRVK